MPKNETLGSIKSILDQDYADAMENLAEGMKKAAAQGLFSPTDVERNFGLYKRTVRMLMSQGDNFIINFFNKVDPRTLTDPQIAKDFATTVVNKLGGFDQQKAMNYAAGIIEGHHGVSVDSIFAAAKHLPMKDRLEFIRILSNEYGVSGTVGGDMYPLSKFAHQGKGTGSVVSKASAHTSANPLEIVTSKGFPVNTGTWSREFDFSNITNPRELADTFMQQSGFPQMAMADKAFDSPEELGIRKELAQKLGIRERDLYTKSKDFNPRGQVIQKKIKELGIDVAEIVHRHYGLPYIPRQPLATDPNAPKPTRTVKPKIVPNFEDATQFAKGWFSESDFLPNTGALKVGKTLGKAASVLPGVGAILDVGDVFAGTQQAMTSSSRQQQTTGALRSASGTLGLASLAAPILAPAALAVSGVSALAERRAAMPKPAQVDQIIPTPKPIMANTPTGVAQLKAMSKSKPLDLINEAQYFIVNPIRSAYDRIFGKRDI